MGLRRLGWAAVVLTALNLGLAVPAIAKTSARTLAQQALSENSAESAAAIAELRDLGPDGLQLFLAVHADRLRIRQGKAAFLETESHYFRLRYAYQIIRLAHYLQDFDRNTF